MTQSMATSELRRDPTFESRLTGSREPLSDADELQLRREMGTLPKGNLRWACSEGQLFLKQLQARVEVHGVAQVSRALSVTRQGLAQMLAKAKDDLQWGDELPSAVEMRPLMSAFEGVKRHRAGGGRASRGTPQYFEVHRTLVPLQDRYSLAVIADVTQIPRRDLERFLGAPDIEAVARYHLGALSMTYSGLRPEALNRDTENTRRFLGQLQLCLTLMSRVKVARALGVTPEQVTGWLRWRDALIQRDAARAPR